jgi:hypothetical protein
MVFLHTCTYYVLRIVRCKISWSRVFHSDPACSRIRMTNFYQRCCNQRANCCWLEHALADKLWALPVAKSQGTIQGTSYSTNEQNALPNFLEYFKEETTIPWLGYRIENLANLTVELARNELISLLIPSAATRTTVNHSKFDTARWVVIVANVTDGND